MKHPFRSHILPFFTVGAGGLGFALRLWLYAGIDEKGLLPVGHPADYLLFLLSALTIGILFLATRKLEPRKINRELLRVLGSLAYAIAGVCLILTAVLKLSGSMVRLAWVAIAAALVGGLILLMMAVMRFFRRRPPYWISAVITVVLMLNTVAQCQVWGAEPQLQEYFFPLLASVFLILCAYEKTKFAAKQGNAKTLAFFSQCALYFCCVSLNTDHWLLYFGMMLWAALQFYPCIFAKKEA